MTTHGNMFKRDQRHRYSDDAVRQRLLGRVSKVIARAQLGGIPGRELEAL